MRILIVSHRYTPSIGGVELVGEILAREFGAAGHDVKVVTETPGEASPEVVRQPSHWELAQAVRWAEVVLHNCISLRALWPMLVVRRPWVVGHHVWLTRADGTVGWQDRLKSQLLRFGTNVAPSKALADALPVSCTVVRNPYRDDLFVERTGLPRTGDLVFVGRLVSDKGADLLIDALASLARQGRRPTLTIVGSGPEEQALRASVVSFGLSEQVTFTGALTGDDLVRVLNAHTVLVVPSRWQEPFGIVALEGIACGCVVVGSVGGGLAQAIGPCGVTFENGDAASLAGTLDHVLSDAALRDKCRAAAAGHLKNHRRREVSQAYLRVIASAVHR